MKTIEVKKIIKALNASDGAGVKLKRSIGTPEADYIDPFLMLDEFGSENKDDYIAGFPPHPHRGIETVTYMLNGEFEHQDSTGAKGIMTSGDVQWMKTGRGIIHSEMRNIGGGGFMLVHLAESDEQVFIDYREMAPDSASQDMFLNEDGTVNKQMAYNSVSAAGIPGRVAGMSHALEK